MKTSTLLLRSLVYFWRTNLAVVLGVATAVAVLAGALLVGESVRASLRNLFLGRLGATDYLLASTSFFRDQLAADLSANPQLAAQLRDCPLIVLSGLVAHEKSGRRASGVQVYGVDERFWQFHRVPERSLSDRDVFLSPDLQREIANNPGDTILLRIEKPSAIPAGSLHGRKEDLSRTIRLASAQLPDGAPLSEFSLRPQQGPVRAVFVSLARLQKDLDMPGKVNTILLAENSAAGPDFARVAANRIALIESSVREAFRLEDLGIRIRVLDRQRGLSVESDSALITGSVYEGVRKAAEDAELDVIPVLSYLANSIRAGSREVPYSLVTAIDRAALNADNDVNGGVTSNNAPVRSSGGNAAGEQSGASAPTAESNLPPIAINQWTAGDLAVKPGDTITLDYYIWEDQGRLRTESARFRLDRIVPLAGAFADRDLVPDYPGITETESISAWDPPFPVDLQKVRPRDEDYWRDYRTTPKAFVPLEEGLKLWESRHGKFTSLRIRGPGRDPGQYAEQFSQYLRKELDPVANGINILAVKSAGLQASQGATDFGEYFVYFSFFLVAAALLLASLFFKLGVEQRLREIGLLRAVGFPPARVRSLFLLEGLVLATIGSLLGAAGAAGYGALMVHGLKTWWVGAVGTTHLTLELSPALIGGGAVGGILVGLLCVAYTLRGLAPAQPRDLLAANLDAVARATTSHAMHSRKLLSSGSVGAATLLAAIVMLICAVAGLVSETAGFFGGGAALLVSSLCYQHVLLKRRSRTVITGNGAWPVSRLGIRNAAYHKGRSVLCVALIAAAAFIIVAVESFKREGSASVLDEKSGNGGYPLLAESLLPLYHDPNTESGREELTLFERDGFDPAKVTFTRFRVRQGDDASCLNLYQPRDPRIIAPEDQFLERGRFSFQGSLAESPEERTNPWLLLNRQYPDGAVPVIADATSLTYALHRKVGDEILLNAGPQGSVRLKIVGALADSIFQGELLMSDANFLRLFPEVGGYSFFLLEVPPESVAAATALLEDQLKDFGFDIMPTAERLAAFHRVENTYISTFQALGGLGLVLGTLGLAAVLLRNALERRREMALLRAVGYGSAQIGLMVLAENAFLVASGLAIGMISALVATAPALFSRGSMPAATVGLLAIVLVTGMAASIAATVASLRTPLIAALRSE